MKLHSDRSENKLQSHSDSLELKMNVFTSLRIQPVKDNLMKAWFINLELMKAIFKYSLSVQPFICEELCANLYWFCLAIALFAAHCI